jgi:soluble lytic murein transglycosylase-like protein
MQLIPATAQRFHVADPFDPESNVRGGLAYLRRLLALFDGDVQLVAAAYNAGEGAVLRHRGVPPYRETRDYVTRIARLYSLPVHRYYRSSSNDPLSKR